jgi:type IV pilus assembly protein PilV
MKAGDPQQGFAMMEVLVTIVIIAFGTLGLVALQAKTALSQLEAYQRSQALILINDISSRMVLNRANAAAYVGIDIGTVTLTCIESDTRAAKDLCEWSRTLQGAAEVEGGTKLGAMIGARGCITSVATDEYLISVVWQGLQPTGAPETACGRDAYGGEDMRRAVTTVLQIGRLS